MNTYSASLLSALHCMIVTAIAYGIDNCALCNPSLLHLLLQVLHITAISKRLSSAHGWHVLITAQSQQHLSAHACHASIPILNTVILI